MLNNVACRQVVVPVIFIKLGFVKAHALIFGRTPTPFYAEQHHFSCYSTTSVAESNIELMSHFNLIKQRIR